MENLEKQERIEKAKLEASFNLWIMTIGGFSMFFIHILASLIGVFQTPAFIFVVVVYTFMAMFIYLLYKPKISYIGEWLRLKIKKQ